MDRVARIAWITDFVEERFHAIAESSVPWSRERREATRDAGVEVRARRSDDPRRERGGIELVIGDEDQRPFDRTGSATGRRTESDGHRLGDAPRGKRPDGFGS